MTSVEQSPRSDRLGRGWRVTGWICVGVHLVALVASVLLAWQLNGERFEASPGDDDAGLADFIVFAMVVMIGFAFLAATALVLLAAALRTMRRALAKVCIGLAVAAAVLELAMAGLLVGILVVT